MEDRFLQLPPTRRKDLPVPACHLTVHLPFFSLNIPSLGLNVCVLRLSKTLISTSNTVCHYGVFRRHIAFTLCSSPVPPPLVQTRRDHAA